MDAAFLIEQRVQPAQVVIHFRELHAGVRSQHHVNGHPALDHQQEQAGGVLAAGEGHGMVCAFWLMRKCLLHSRFLLSLGM